MSFLSSSLIQRLSPIIEKAINKALTMDPTAQAKLKPLEGCLLEINITTLEKSIFMRAESGHITLTSAEKKPSVVLKGSIPAFTELAARKDRTMLFKQKRIELYGDAVRAQQIQMFAKSLNIDWEGLLAEGIGDAPAKLITSGARQGFNMLQLLSKNFLQDMEEYVKYELKLLPNKASSLKQFEAIDQIRLATDRLDARVKGLLSSKRKGG